MDLAKSLDDLQRRRWAIPVTAAMAIFFFVMGWYLAFHRPGRLARESQIAATAAIDQAQSACMQVDERIQQMGWFRATYTQHPRELVTQARGQLDQGDNSAAALLRKGSSGGWHSRVVQNTQAKATADSARAKAEQAGSEIDEALRQRDAAFQKLTEFSSASTRLSASLSAVTGRIAAETPRYPSKYATELKQAHGQLEPGTRDLAPVLSDAKASLPPKEDHSGKGDPTRALSLLGTGLSRAGDLQGVADGALKRLDWLKNADDQAAAKVAAAEQNTAQTRSWLSGKQQSTGYWLKDAEGVFAQAKTQSEEARRLLTTNVAGESVPDRPAAFQAAAGVDQLCADTTSRANAEISLAETAHNRCLQLATEITAYATLVAPVDDYRAKLQAHHNSSVWPSSNFARSTVSFANRKAAALALTALDVQRFADADQAAKAALTDLRNEAAKVRSFTEEVDKLERARLSYSQVYNRARDTIDDESDKVRQYGSYDSSAKSDYEDAVSALRSAKSKASDNLYVTAVEEAQRAQNLADGTGARAKRAYDRKQEEEAAARRRREEEARQQREQSQPTGGGGFGSSSSHSNGGGGGYHSSGSHSSGSGGGHDSSGHGGGHDSSGRGGGHDSRW